MQMDTDKRSLEGELLKYKSLEKERRLLNEQIVDMETEIKRLTDLNNGLNYKHAGSEETTGRLRN